MVMRPDRNFQEQQRKKWNRVALVAGGLGIAAMAGGGALLVDSTSVHPLLSSVMSSGLEQGLGYTSLGLGTAAVLGSSVRLTMYSGLF